MRSVSCPPTPPPGFLSHVRYRFVDCRWSLDDPEPGAAPTSRATFRARCSSTSSATFVGAAGAGRAPSAPRAGRVRRSGRARRDRADTFVVAYGSLGGAERLWWLLRHFGHDACAVIDLDGLARPARGRRGARRAGRLRAAASAPDDTIELDELAAPARRARRRRRAPPGPLPRRAEPDRPRARAGSRAPSTRRGPSRCRRYPTASSSPTAARA